MSHPDEEFVIFEDYDFGSLEPKQLFVGRFIAPSDRDAIVKYSLKTREYISTTSMDSELALVTANLTLASPGKLFYDPFVGTGSFPIACSHFGAVSMGSDIDGRSLRGRRKKLKKRKEDEGEGEDGSGGGEKNVVTSFRQYGLSGRYLDGFISDLTHSPLRSGKGERFLDGILCDPPYGVREGLKVLGSKHGSGKEPVFIDGKAAHLCVSSQHSPYKRQGQQLMTGAVQTRRPYPPQKALQFRSHARRHSRVCRRVLGRRGEIVAVDADGERRGSRVRRAESSLFGGREYVCAELQQV